MFLVTLCLVLSHSATSWSIQTVDENGDGFWLSMALDSKDNPHLCYIDYVDGYYRNPTYLTYASWNGSNWLIQNVTYSSHVGDVNLALDSNNNPHVAYNYLMGVGILYASGTGENIRDTSFLCFLRS